MVRRLYRGWPLLLALCSSLAQALDLSGAWQTVQREDPAFSAAQQEHEAGQQYRALGRAGLLPQASISASRSQVSGENVAPNIFGKPVTSNVDYTSTNKTLQVRQPLLNWARWSEARQGYARADASDAILVQKTQGLAQQLASRYFSALLARQTVALAGTKLTAIQELLDSARRRFELGDGTVTDIDEAASRRDLARAELIEAQNQLLIARRELQEMLGYEPPSLATLRPQFVPIKLTASLDAWTTRALTHNPDVQAQQAQLRVADAEVGKSVGAHLPTVDLVGSLSKADSESLTSRGQRSDTRSIGLQLNIPLFAGGYHTAATRQAIAQRERARDELEVLVRKISSEVTRQYNSVTSSGLRTEALAVAAVSSERALQSMKKGVLAGTHSNVDILNAEDQLFRARRDLLEARMVHLLARLKLAAVAGELDEAAIGAVNAYLGPALALAL